jgi:DNA-binding transcriptional ArsR family regulator
VSVDTKGRVVDLMKLLGEATRIDIVRRLAVEDLCTCHLVEDLGVAQPLVSHHLRALRQAGIVHTDRSGAFTYYVLDREALAELASEIGELATRTSGRQRRRPCS